MWIKFEDNSYCLALFGDPRPSHRTFSYHDSSYWKGRQKPLDPSELWWWCVECNPFLERFERKVSVQSHRRDSRWFFLFLKTDQGETLSLEHTSFQAKSLRFCCDSLTFKWRSRIVFHSAVAIFFRHPSVVLASETLPSHPVLLSSVNGTHSQNFCYFEVLRHFFFAITRSNFHKARLNDNWMNK